MPTNSTRQYNKNSGRNKHSNNNSNRRPSRLAARVAIAAGGRRARKEVAVISATIALNKAAMLRVAVIVRRRWS